MLTAGLGGATRHACVALSSGDRLLGVCEQERVTRVRGAGFNHTGLPDEALDMLLARVGRSRDDIGRYVVADDSSDTARHDRLERVNQHYAHACASYLSSPFASAAVVVCSPDAPGVSVWVGRGATIARVEWPWRGPSLSDVYARCVTAFGFGPTGGGQRFEALARLRPDSRDEAVNGLMSGDGVSISVAAGLEAAIEARLSGTSASVRSALGSPALGSSALGSPARAGLAAALQARLIDLLIEFLALVRRTTACEHLCLGGSLFYHSSINSAAKRSGLFADVFVPVDPGAGGLAVGAALHAGGWAPQRTSPFLGPEFAAHEVKATLDNCKLQYTWESEDGAIDAAVQALQRGTLVGWFDGAMEWGLRALGARCILANPFAPYVLENLNGFLKHREPWRGYALSGPQAAVGEDFDGPSQAPYMECDFRPREPGRFSRVLPSPEAAIRVHTVDQSTPPRFRRLLQAFTAATGVPYLVNTSFSAAHEPIVCTPRDAVRVYYGSGLDVLVLDRFVLKK